MNQTHATVRSVLFMSVVAASVSAGVACSMFQSSDREEEPQQLVGEPPAEENPFAYQGRPDETSRVETSGRLEGTQPGTGSPTPDAGAPSGGEPAAASGVATNQTEETTASSNMPQPPADSRQPDPTEYRCFSCVRLCPTGESPCEPGRRDMICGWGVHSDKGAAEQLARAECSGALDRERRRDRWDDIKGECPPANCRKPEDRGADR